MNLSDIDPATVSQLKFQLMGDMTATVAIVFTDGTLDVFPGQALAEAKELQLAVSQNQPQLSRPTVELDPHENEPGPPVYQTPCGICGTLHPVEGNPVCRCVFCFQIKEIVHSGACADCARNRFGHYFEAMGAPIAAPAEVKPPWLK